MSYTMDDLTREYSLFGLLSLTHIFHATYSLMHRSDFRIIKIHFKTYETSSDSSGIAFVFAF